MLESLNSRKFEISIFQVRVRQTQDVVDATSTRTSDDFALPTSPISGLDVEAEPRPLFNDEASERNCAIQVFHWLIDWLIVWQIILIVSQISSLA